MEHKHHPPSLVGPSLLIGFGILLLLRNLGYLEWEFWQLLRLWPALLIVGGVELLLQGHTVGRILTSVIILAALVGGLWFITSVNDPRSTTDLAYPRERTTSLILDLKPSVADVTLDAYADSANLVEGKVSLPSGIRLVEEFSAGTRSRLRMSTLPRSRRWWPGQHESWDLRILAETVLDLAIDQGIGALKLDLSDLNINSANVDFGIATAVITLPEKGNFDMVLDGGIGTILIQVPASMAAHIEMDGGIVTRTFPARFVHANNNWTSPGFDSSENQVTINLSLGIGTVTVREIAQP